MMTYEGKPALTAALFDVTLSKQAEQTMADARDQAEAASRAKTEFLANMSHEIRTPLNGVTGVAQILRQTSLSPQQAEMVRLIETSAVTLERLLSDILDLARVESGRLEINPEPFNLDAAVRATAALSELRAREKGIGFEVVIDPAAAGAVVGDEGRIKQILFNLLSNAVKFTPAGRVSLRVSVDDRLEPPRFTFVVADTGVGFQPECRDRLFSRFEQEDGSITRQFGGSGLGLAISRDLAELMGGALEADSEPGRGATFTLRLDLPWAEAAAETEWEAAPAFVSGQEPRPLRVLLAEDHPINQKVVELMLAPMGADLSCVGNGQEAVEAVAAGRFDVVLMDMQMPVMDGLTAIRLIRERERREGGPPTPIFTLSANAMSEHVEASLAAGADRHLTKPIAAPVLFGALGEIAEQVAMAEAA
jgi:CheY-like chemotaxis protein/nitrogen-specific signal transduction histidine kinase